MPCYQPPEDDVSKEELDRLTRYLCATCRHIEYHGLKVADVNEQVSIWWEDHKKFDKIRKKESRDGTEGE